MSEKFKCARCSARATQFVFEEGCRASGYFACSDCAPFFVSNTPTPVIEILPTEKIKHRLSPNQRKLVEALKDGPRRSADLADERKKGAYGLAEHGGRGNAVYRGLVALQDRGLAILNGSGQWELTEVGQELV